MRRLVRRILDSRLLGGERGGVAIMMLLAFMVLAVPLAVVAAQTSGQLARNSRVYDKRLTGMYNASGGVEAALFDLLNDPDFDDELTPSNPDTVVTTDINNETVPFTSESRTRARMVPSAATA